PHQPPSTSPAATGGGRCSRPSAGAGTDKPATVFRTASSESSWRKQPAAAGHRSSQGRGFTARATSWSPSGRAPTSLSPEGGLVLMRPQSVSAFACLACLLFAVSGVQPAGASQLIDRN